MPSQPPKLLDQGRDALRTRHYPAHAEEASVAWIERFILFHDKRHPDTLTAAEVMAFLNTLADPAERSQARIAILFPGNGPVFDLPHQPQLPFAQVNVPCPQLAHSN